MTRRRLWIALAGAAAVAVLLAVAIRPHLGSGTRCEGIGFGCDLERDTDTLLVLAVYSGCALLALLCARRLARRRIAPRGVLIAGLAVTVLATGATAWSQLPRHPLAPGPLGPAAGWWERAFEDGRAAAPAGTELGDALRRLRRSGPATCRDEYERDTGGRELRWSATGRSDPESARLVAAWAERLRRRGIVAAIADPSTDPDADRRLQVDGAGPGAGGRMYVRASTYISQLEITASTGCHGD